MRPMSIAQVFLTVVGLAAIAFSQYAGPAQATLVSAAVALLFWLRQPPSNPPPGAAKAVLVGIIAGVFSTNIIACAALGTVTPQDAKALVDEGAGLDSCERKAEAEGDSGKNLHVYHDCLKEGGL